MAVGDAEVRFWLPGIKRALEPAYQQPSAILRARIAKGEWRSGPLPSVKQLQQQYDIGRDTVLHAIEMLREEGLVFTVPRRGTYVSPRHQVAGRRATHATLRPATGLLHEQAQPSARATPTGQETPVPPRPQYPFGFSRPKGTAGDRAI